LNQIITDFDIVLIGFKPSSYNYMTKKWAAQLAALKSLKGGKYHDSTTSLLGTS